LAEYPAAKRDASKLMVVHRATGKIEHRHFYDIHEYFDRNDLLVRNNTRVKPVRFLARKEHLKGAQLEVLLIKHLSGSLYEAYIDPLKKIKEGSILLFGEGLLKAIVVKIFDQRYVHLDFLTPEKIEDREALLRKLGKMPIPRYIKRKPEEIDQERYQTVFAKEESALAAPTSALHFTQDLFDKITQKGTQICDLSLEIGLGTFNPVYAENITDHEMHRESFTIPFKTAEAINQHKKSGKRVIALGTTSIRATESAYKNDSVQSGRFSTDIFIYPPYEFKVADALITNFHTPRSTLLMLVSAFAGYDLIMKAYREAIANNYRFYSYGDAMLII
jgi:S-adenosylmethionine:tRNA ribosyltransferase-isomerase